MRTTKPEENSMLRLNPVAPRNARATKEFGDDFINLLNEFINTVNPYGSKKTQIKKSEKIDEQIEILNTGNKNRTLLCIEKNGILIETYLSIDGYMYEIEILKNPDNPHERYYCDICYYCKNVFSDIEEKLKITAKTDGYNATYDIGLNSKDVAPFKKVLDDAMRFMRINIEIAKKYVISKIVE